MSLIVVGVFGVSHSGGGVWCIAKWGGLVRAAHKNPITAGLMLTEPCRQM